MQRDYAEKEMNVLEVRNRKRGAVEKEARQVPSEEVVVAARLERESH